MHLILYMNSDYPERRLRNEAIWKDNIILQQYIGNTGILVVHEKKT